MKGERTFQVVLVLVGLFYSFWDYFPNSRAEGPRPPEAWADTAPAG